MVNSFWSKTYAVTRWTNRESLGEHPMWMFLHLFSSVVQPGHWYCGIGQASAVCQPMVLWPGTCPARPGFHYATGLVAYNYDDTTS